MLQKQMKVGEQRVLKQSNMSQNCVNFQFLHMRFLHNICAIITLTNIASFGAAAPVPSSWKFMIHLVDFCSFSFSYLTISTHPSYISTTSESQKCHSGSITRMYHTHLVTLYPHRWPSFPQPFGFQNFRPTNTYLNDEHTLSQRSFWADNIYVSTALHCSISTSLTVVPSGFHIAAFWPWPSHPLLT